MSKRVWAFERVLAQLALDAGAAGCAVFSTLPASIVGAGAAVVSAFATVFWCTVMAPVVGSVSVEKFAVARALLSASYCFLATSRSSLLFARSRIVVSRSLMTRWAHSVGVSSRGAVFLALISAVDDVPSGQGMGFSAQPTRPMARTTRRTPSFKIRDNITKGLHFRPNWPVVGRRDPTYIQIFYKVSRYVGSVFSSLDV
jgi:hypothetical protein